MEEVCHEPKDTLPPEARHGLEPVREEGPPSYNHKELNSSNNLKELKKHSPLEPPESVGRLHSYFIQRDPYQISDLQNC